MTAARASMRGRLFYIKAVIDSATERSYNVNTGTYSNTTYKTKNTYNGYHDELIKVAAQNGNTQLCANEMTYPDGNSFTVTDGKVRYKGAHCYITWVKNL